VAKAADGGLGSMLPRPLGYGIGAFLTVLGLVLFIMFLKRNKAKL